MTMPHITGPRECARGGPPPEFDVDPGDGPAIYYGVELASSPNLLQAAEAAYRTSSNYYASWSDASLIASNPYVLPVSSWERLRDESRLFYRAWFSADPSDWVDTV